MRAATTSPWLRRNVEKHKISASFGQKVKAEKLPAVFTASFAAINRDAEEISDGF